MCLSQQEAEHTLTSGAQRGLGKAKNGHREQLPRVPKTPKQKDPQKKGHQQQQTQKISAQTEMNWKNC